jgi:hypothetical protein
MTGEIDWLDVDYGEELPNEWWEPVELAVGK